MLTLQNDIRKRPRNLQSFRFTRRVDAYDQRSVFSQMYRLYPIPAQREEILQLIGRQLGNPALAAGDDLIA